MGNPFRVVSLIVGQGNNAVFNPETGEFLINGSTIATSIDIQNLSNEIGSINSSLGGISSAISNIQAIDGTQNTRISNLELVDSTHNALLAKAIYRDQVGNISIGQDSSADSIFLSSVAIGRGAITYGVNGSGIAIGEDTTAQGGVAIGRTANTIDGISIGPYTRGGGIAVGNTIQAESFAVGVGLDSTSLASGIAIGYQSFCNQWGIGIGAFSKCESQNSVAIGYNAKCNGASAIAIGSSSDSSGSQSIAIGTGAISSYNYSIAIGYNATTTENQQFRIGGTGSNTLNLSVGGYAHFEKGIRLTTDSSSTSFSAMAGTLYFVDATAPISINPPTLPQAGDTFEIMDRLDLFATNNVTVNFTGTKFNGASSISLVLNVSGISARFVYVNATTGWKMR